MTMANILGFACIGIKFRGLHGLQKRSDIRLRKLRVGKHVFILSGEHASDTIATSIKISAAIPMEGLDVYSRLPCRRNASGASGWMMMSHALRTSTCRIDLRLIFLLLVLDPRVATSLNR